MKQPIHRHGRSSTGRALVAAGLALVVASDIPVFLVAGNSRHPVPAVEVSVIIILVWLLAGVFGIWRRRIWGRYFILFILSLGTIGFALAGIMVALTGDPVYSGLPLVLFLAALVYLTVALVVNHSLDVKRLTSRAYE